MDTPIWRGAARSAPADAFAAAAQALRCEEAALRAVWDVEAAGRAFRADGSLERRFEPHHFPEKHWPALDFVPLASAPWRVSKSLSFSEREAAFALAYRLDPEAALRATSWGALQVMGFNHLATGHASATDLVVALAEEEAEHLRAFVALVAAWKIDTALRARDWRAFARRYNGTGQPEVYAARIEAAYRKRSGLPSPVVLRIGDRGASVRQLQRALGVAQDGAFGPATHAAVEAFQREHGLVVDGIVGARTWAALGDVTPEAQPVRVARQEDSTSALAHRVEVWGRIGSVVSGLAAAASSALGGLFEAVPDGAATVLALACGGALVVLAAGWAVRIARTRSRAV